MNFKRGQRLQMHTRKVNLTRKAHKKGKGQVLAFAGTEIDGDVLNYQGQVSLLNNGTEQFIATHRGEKATLLLAATGLDEGAGAELQREVQDHFHTGQFDGITDVEDLHGSLIQVLGGVKWAYGENSRLGVLRIEEWRKARPDGVISVKAKGWDRHFSGADFLEQRMAQVKAREAKHGHSKERRPLRGPLRSEWNRKKQELLKIMADIGHPQPLIVRPEDHEWLMVELDRLLYIEDFLSRRNLSRLGLYYMTDESPSRSENVQVCHQFYPALDAARLNKPYRTLSKRLIEGAESTGKSQSNVRTGFLYRRKRNPNRDMRDALTLNDTFWRRYKSGHGKTEDTLMDELRAHLISTLQADLFHEIMVDRQLAFDFPGHSQ